MTTFPEPLQLAENTPKSILCKDPIAALLLGKKVVVFCPSWRDKLPPTKLPPFFLPAESEFFFPVDKIVRRVAVEGHHAFLQAYFLGGWHCLLFWRVYLLKASVFSRLLTSKNRKLPQPQDALLHSMKYCLCNRDPYDGFLQTPQNWVSSPIYPKQRGFFHCSGACLIGLPLMVYAIIPIMTGVVFISSLIK